MSGLGVTATAIFGSRVVPYREPGVADAKQMPRLLDHIAARDIGKVRAGIEQERMAEAALAIHRVCPAERRPKID